MKLYYQLSDILKFKSRAVIILICVLAGIVSFAYSVKSSENFSSDKQNSIESESSKKLLPKQVRRLSFSFGPTEAVEEAVEEADKKANKHWRQVYENTCKLKGVNPENCDKVPSKVQNFWENNENKAPSAGVTISGSLVTNPPIPNTRVYLTNDGIDMGNQGLEAQTNDNGEFVIHGVDRGSNYLLEMGPTPDGFEDQGTGALQQINLENHPPDDPELEAREASEVVSDRVQADIEVSTANQLRVSSTKNRLQGEINAINLDDYAPGDEIIVYFQYRRKGTDEWKNTSEQRSAEGDVFTQTISGLQEDLEYEYRAVAEPEDPESGIKIHGMIEQFKVSKAVKVLTSGETWTSFGGNPHNTSNSSLPGNIQEPHVKWGYVTQASGIRGAGNSPIVASTFGSKKPNVLISNTNGVYAHKGKNGDIDWLSQWNYYDNPKENWPGDPSSGRVAPAVGDLKGDDRKEIVLPPVLGENISPIHGNGDTRGINDFITLTYPIGGQNEPGEVERSSPVIADANGDGNLNIVVGDHIGPGTSDQGGLYLYGSPYDNGTNSPLGSTLLDRSFRNSPAVGDITGNGTPEVVVGTDNDNEEVYAVRFRKNGSIQQIWDFEFQGNEEVDYHVSSPTLADTNGNGRKTVFVASSDKIHALNGQTGNIEWTFNYKDRGSFTGSGPLASWEVSPAVGDVTGDGELEIVVGVNTADDGQNRTNVYVLDSSNGNPVWNYELETDNIVRGVKGSPLIADVTGNGESEVIISANGGRVYTLDGDKNVSEESRIIWQVNTGERIYSGLTGGDVDEDGKLEIIVGRDGRGNHNGIVFVIDGNDGVAPEAPENLKTTVKDVDEIELRWDPVNYPDPTLDHNVYRRPSNSNQQWEQIESSITQTDFTNTHLVLDDEGLNPSTEYEYAVEAVDRSGLKSSRNQISDTTLSVDLMFDESSLAVTDREKIISEQKLDGDSSLLEFRDHVVSVPAAAHADDVDLYYTLDGSPADDSDNNVDMDREGNNDGMDTWIARIPKDEVSGGDEINFIIQGTIQDHTASIDNEGNGYSYNVLEPVGIQTTKDTWPMMGGNLHRTANSELSGEMEYVTHRWVYNTGDSVFSSPAVASIDANNNKIVIGSDNGKIYALNSDGSKDWHFSSGDKIRSSPAIGDLNNSNNGNLEVVFGSDDKRVYALDQNGNEIWNYPTGGKVRSSPAVANIDNDDNLEVIVGSDDGNLYVLDGSSGNEEWKFTGSQGKVRGAPVVANLDDDNNLEVVVGSHDHYVYGIDSDGSKLWKFKTGGPVGPGLAVSDVTGDGQLNVLVGSLGGPGTGDSTKDELYALDGSNGEVEWSNSNIVWTTTSPAIGDITDDGGREILVDDNDKVRILRGTDGKEITAGADLPLAKSNPALVSLVESRFGDDPLEFVIGTEDKNIYGLEDSNFSGNLKDIWSFETAGSVQSSPAVADLRGNGSMSIVFGSHDGRVHALKRNILPPELRRVETLDESRIELYWWPGDSDQTGSNDEYIIYRSESPGADPTEVARVQVDGASDRTYIDSNLDPKTRYFYRIRHVVGNDTSDFSKEDSARTLSDEITFDTTTLSVGYQKTKFSYEQLGGNLDLPDNRNHSLEVEASGHADVMDLYYTLDGSPATTSDNKISMNRSKLEDDRIKDLWSAEIPRSVLSAGDTVNFMIRGSIAGNTKQLDRNGNGHSYGVYNYKFANPQTVSGTWPSFHGPPKNTGRSEVTGEMFWADYRWGINTSGIFASPVSADVTNDPGREVVVGSYGKKVYLLDKDGNVIWDHDVDGTIRATPAIDDLEGNGDKEIIVATMSGSVYVLAGNDGSEKWRFQSNRKFGASPAIEDLNEDGTKNVVVGARNGVLYVLDGSSGNENWRKSLGGFISSSPAIGDVNGDDNPEIVVGNEGGYVQAWDGDGNLEWAFKTDGSVKSSPVLADVRGNGRLDVGIGSNDGNLYLLDGKSGKEVWSFSNSDNEIISSPAVGDLNNDNRQDVVVGSKDGSVFAVDGFTGKKHWESSIAPSIGFSSPAIANVSGEGDPEIVIGTEDGRLHGLDGTDGSREWHIKIGNNVQASPAVVDINNDDKVEIIAGALDGRLYLLEESIPPPQNPLAKSESPNRVRLSWTPTNKPEGTNFQKYRVYRKTPAQSRYQLQAEITEKFTNFYSDQDLDPETTYNYRLTQVNTDGDESRFTSTETAITPELTDEFDPLITSTNEPIIETETLSVDVEVRNLGDTAGTQEIVLEDFGSNTVDAKEVTLDSGATKTLTLTWQTEDGDGGVGAIKVVSEDNFSEEFITVIAPIEPVSASGTWPSFGGNPHRTGLSELKGDLDTVNDEWSFSSGGPVSSSPVIADVNGDGSREIIVGSNDNNVYAINRGEGTEEWSFNTGDKVSSAPVVADVDDDGNLEVIVFSDDSNVYALNGATGKQEWSVSTKATESSSPLVADVDQDGDLEVVVGTNNGNIFVFSGADGVEKWSRNLTDGGLTSPALADVDGDGNDEIIIGSQDNNVYALDNRDGSEVWSFATNGSVNSPPAVADVTEDGTLEVLAGSNDNNLYAIDGENGTEEWNYNSNESIVSSPSVGDVTGDGSLEVVVGSTDRFVYALDGSDGSEIWNNLTNGPVKSSPAIVDLNNDGAHDVIVGSDDFELYGLNGPDGNMTWNFNTEGAVVSSPAIADVNADSSPEVAFGSNDNKLYLLGSGAVDRDVWYVNDSEQTNDVFTQETGSDSSGDGSSEAPFRTITHAMNLVTEGDTVKVDAGTYGETVTIDTNNLSLIGADSSLTRLKLDASDSTNSSNVGVYADTQMNLLIRDLWIKHASIGIVFDNVSQSTIDSVITRDNNRYGVKLRSKSELNVIKNIISKNNQYAGFEIESSKNTFKNSKTFQNGSGFVILGRNNTIENNVSSNNDRYGYDISSSNNTLSKNTSSDNGFDGYVVGESNNTLVENTSSNNGRDGFRFTAFANDNSLTNNSSTGNAASGFYIRDSQNNNLTSNSASKNDDHGIEIDGVSNHKLMKNIATENKKHGFNIRSSEKNTLMSNEASNNSKVGFHLAASDSNSIVQNTADSNDSSAIKIAYSFSPSLNNDIRKNNILRTGKTPDSGLINEAEDTNIITRNWWGTTDESVIANMVDDPINDTIPYRLGMVDTGVGADTIAPAEPVMDDVISVDDTTAEVRWLEVTTDERGNPLNDFQEYRLYRTTSKTETDWKQNATLVTTIASRTNTDYKDFGLNTGQTYYYRLTAVDDASPENESFFSSMMSNSSGSDSVFQAYSEPMVEDEDGTGLSSASIAMADIDNDGDSDLAVSGNDYFGKKRLIVYKNDGSGNFTKSSEPMVADNDGTGVRYSSIAFKDLDGDGDPDLIVTGRDENRSDRLITYINDGTGTFSKNLDLNGVSSSSIASGDIEGDGNNDLAVSGSDKLIIYGNDGSGNLTKISQPMVENKDGTGVNSSSIALGDVDGDGDNDLVVSGTDLDGNDRLILYENDGSGTFTKMGEPMIGDGVGLRRSSVALGDVTGDGHLDLAVSGKDANSSKRLILYENNGSGTFTKMAEPMIGDGGGVINSSISLADYNNDGNLDLIVSGEAGYYTSRLIVYENDGTGNFTKIEEPMLGDGEGIRYSSLQLGDITGDGSMDLIAAGTDSNYTNRLILFENTK